MTAPTRLRRWGVLSLGAATLTATVPLVLSSGGPASAQASPAASACASASPSSTASTSPSATSTASTSPSPSGLQVPSAVASLLATGSPSATPTSSTSPSATPTASTSPCPTPSATVSSSPSATATATTSTSPSATVQRLGISVSPATITPGVVSVVTVTGRPGSAVELYAYSRPSTTYTVVRRGVVDEFGRVEFRVTPGTNTRLYAQVAGSPQSASSSVVINVRTALSLTVVRNGSLDYTFQGRILPRRAGQLITLYRVDRGREIITKQIKTDSTGTYRIRRVFVGQGTFGFLTRTGQTLTNAAGVSNGGKARPTSIYAGPRR